MDNPEYRRGNAWITAAYADVDDGGGDDGGACDVDDEDGMNDVVGAVEDCIDYGD